VWLDAFIRFRFFFFVYTAFRMTAAMITDLIYGYRVKDEDDRLVSLIGQAAEEFSEAIMPGAHLVDTFPWREYYLHSLPLHWSNNFSSRPSPLMVAGYGLQSQSHCHA
jgi:tRNA G10  N-methylase Trm11